ncbi:MAG: type II secretion system F family protein [Candidatus Magasanikbacteria bacterium]|jgi:type II secretory pathway component PulF|nr:type II secretion system F family protein [Candidatus Magasanikbacteria bacterium]
MAKKKVVEDAVKEPAQIEMVKPVKMTFTEQLKYAGTVSKKQILFFTKNIAVMLEAGSTLPEALDVMSKHVKGKLQFVIMDLAQQVQHGHRFSYSLARHRNIFPNSYINMIEVGESTGRLGENLQRLAHELEKGYELKKKIIGASLYPGIVFIGGITLSFGIAIFILPKVAKLFRNFKVELPWTTRALMGVADFFQDHGSIAIGGTFFGMIFIYWFLKRAFMRPITHWFILHLPVMKSVSLHLNLTLFCRTLSSLLESGVTIDEAIRVCQKSVSNIYFKRFLGSAYTNIKAGDSLTALLETKKKLFPATDVQIIHIGERSGTLSTSLKYCADIHEKEVDNITKNMATILEPILLVLIGIMVGFLALSIITPIYSITSNLKA